MSLEGWNTFFQWASAVAAGLTFAAGVGVVITGLKVSKRQDERVTMARRDAATATEKAAVAREGTARALKETAAINERSKSLELQVAEQQRAAEAQRERAAKAERELLEIREKIKPRTIDANRRQSLLALLKSASPKGAVTVVSVLGDSEALAYALQIADVLRSAGWRVGDVGQTVYTTKPVGLFVGVKSVTALPARAVALRNAFGAAGIDLEPTTLTNLSTDDVEVLVGNKP